LVVSPTFRVEEGWVVPAKDTVPIAQRLGTTWHIEAALKYVERRECVVQAGGNIGQWPAYLAYRFKDVHTFEPDPDNFTALTMNTRKYHNIVRYQAGLGAEYCWMRLEREQENCEASFLGTGDIEVPIYPLDMFALAPDLILLDVEGYELPALEGAIETIHECRPVILLEKRHQARYGYEWGEVEELLKDEGYSKATTASHDEIWVPK
jgi:FkbM family methyltransferase